MGDIADAELFGSGGWRMRDKKIALACPECHLPANAVLNVKFNKFIIYTCPRCRSNVVFYRDKVETISDKLVDKLIRQGQLRFCGKVLFNNFQAAEAQSSREKPITADDITNLKILLETEQDAAKIISRL